MGDRFVVCRLTICSSGCGRCSGRWSQLDSSMCCDLSCLSQVAQAAPRSSVEHLIEVVLFLTQYHKKTLVHSGPLSHCAALQTLCCILFLVRECIYQSARTVYSPCVHCSKKHPTDNLLVRKVGLKADKNELNTVASKRW